VGIIDDEVRRQIKLYWFGCNTVSVRTIWHFHISIFIWTLYQYMISSSMFTA
jgi:hypothetical protein